MEGGLTLEDTTGFAGGTGVGSFSIKRFLRFEDCGFFAGATPGLDAVLAGGNQGEVPPPPPPG